MTFLPGPEESKCIAESLQTGGIEVEKAITRQRDSIKEIPSSYIIGSLGYSFSLISGTESLHQFLAILFNLSLLSQPILWECTTNSLLLPI